MELQSVNYKNDELKVDINCYVDKKNEIWFRGKEIAKILEYKNTRKAIIDHVDEDDKKLIDHKIRLNSRVTKSDTQAEDQNSSGNETLPQAEDQNSSGNETLPQAEGLKTTRKCFFINESGFYSLILSSKLPTAKEFKRWVTGKVLPSIRKKGYYSNLMFKSEYDLHCKVVDFLRNKYSEALLIAGIGENQRTESVRINSWKKGYMAGQCDLMIVNPTSKYNSLYIEFKSPSGSFQLSEKQQEMKELYEKNKCKYIVSNSYDDIILDIIKHMEESNKYIKRRLKNNN